MNGIMIAAGVGLTLFGVRFLRKGLDRLWGAQLVRWLAGLSGRPSRAFLNGIAAGVIAPSSTGLALTAAQLSGRQVDPGTALAMLLGANAGMTVMVQLLALEVQPLAGALILIGVIGFQFLRPERLRGIGQCLLALGFIFLAMGLIAQGARPLAESADAATVFKLLQGHPWLVLFTVCGLAVLLQSSTSTIALGLSLHAAGLIPFAWLSLWVIATNLGLSLTSVIAGWTALESRRLGISHVIIKGAAVLALMLLPDLVTRAFALLPGSPARQTALFHTGFNLITGLIALPWLGPVSRLTVRLLPAPAQSESTSFLDPRALASPALALASATRETLRMSDQVRFMLDQFWQAFLAGDAARAQTIRQLDDPIDHLNYRLKDYLSRIEEPPNPEDVHWQFTLLSFANELEAVGDLIDRHLCDQLVKQNHDGVALSCEDRQRLIEIHRRVSVHFDFATTYLTTRRQSTAAELRHGKTAFNLWCRQLQQEHYAGLTGTAPETLRASAYFLDYLNGLRRINSHVSTIGYTFHGSGAQGLPA